MYANQITDWNKSFSAFKSDSLFSIKINESVNVLSEYATFDEIKFVKRSFGENYYSQRISFRGRDNSNDEFKWCHKVILVKQLIIPRTEEDFVLYIIEKIEDSE